MGKQNDVGVYKKDNGYWEYRFVVVVDGKQIARKKCTDDKGNKLKTKKEAIKARELAIASAKLERERKRTISRRTMKEVFAEYCKEGRKDRKYQTIRKQDSLWENHLCEKFGKRFIDEISVAEVNDYLAELYYTQEYSYQYTESFLKMFYLIFGQAYSRNYLEVDQYNKLCVNKDTRIKMPKLKSEDDTDIVSFSRSELSQMDTLILFNTLLYPGYVLLAYWGISTLGKKKGYLAAVIGALLVVIVVFLRAPLPMAFGLSWTAMYFVGFPIFAYLLFVGVLVIMKITTGRK